MKWWRKGTNKCGIQTCGSPVLRLTLPRPPASGAEKTWLRPDFVAFLSYILFCSIRTSTGAIHQQTYAQIYAHFVCVINSFLPDHISQNEKYTVLYCQWIIYCSSVNTNIKKTYFLIRVTFKSSNIFSWTFLLVTECKFSYIFLHILHVSMISQDVVFPPLTRVLSPLRLASITVGDSSLLWIIFVFMQSSCKLNLDAHHLIQVTMSR